MIFLVVSLVGLAVFVAPILSILGYIRGRAMQRRLAELSDEVQTLRGQLTALHTRVLAAERSAAAPSAVAGRNHRRPRGHGARRAAASARNSTNAGLRSGYHSDRDSSAGPDTSHSYRASGLCPAARGAAGVRVFRSAERPLASPASGGWAPSPTPPAPPRPPRVTPPAFQEPGDTPPPPPGFDWESMLGIRGAAWLGGVALVIAALFFAKWSIDQGFFSPVIRIVDAAGRRYGRARLGRVEAARWVSDHG